MKDPNQEVETWKDAFYNDFKDIQPLNLEKYFEREADNIFKKNHIKAPSVKIIRSPEHISV